MWGLGLGVIDHPVGILPLLKEGLGDSPWLSESENNSESKDGSGTSLVASPVRNLNIMNSLPPVKLKWP